MIPRRHAVLFDLDGTLIDTAADLAAAANAVLIEEGGNALPLAALRPWVSRGGRALLICAFPGRDAQFVDRLVPRFLAHYAAAIAVHSRPFAGVLEVLGRIEDKHLRWGIVTNKPIALAEALLAALDLRSRCAVLVGGDSLALRKPDPAPLLHACTRLGVDPGDAVYIGDDGRDVQAARAALMPVLAVAWGYVPPGEVIADWCADAVVATPQDLLEVEPLHSWLRTLE